ncbi:unnamed protein product [Darwinula stevensoni]|uniref:Sjoegren syndrome/scleroderma autoantigen 1 n=1 Tax=Darwinula stevensoni TaxID=69355 RepID=A0A7R9A761_9CRUS|nr:unnamed protein product [Darwinula stevensoni]CAG0891770.1 unnamed protein product [Darwinula stevensoni]
MNETRLKSDLISKTLGDYLLKGYRMLNATCEACGTVLLQDKDKNLLCVACKEIDPPRSLPETVLTLGESSLGGGTTSVQIAPSAPHGLVGDHKGNKRESYTRHSHAVSVLHTRLQGAISELEGTPSTEHAASLCDLIKRCADAIVAVNKMEMCLETPNPLF